jgi:hypothetical protein
MTQTIATETASCRRCQGSGILKGITDSTIGVNIPDKTCFYCSGTGTFNAPDLQEIMTLIKGRKGLRSRRPENVRAYYVWRLARFHGGVDVTLPVMAEMDIAGDPYRNLLDTWAQQVAHHVYGSGTRGIDRWHQAMYGC